MEMGIVKKYIMVNKANGARIECTEKYVPHWISRGFDVEEIRNPSGPKDTKTAESGDAK